MSHSQRNEQNELEKYLEEKAKQDKFEQMLDAVNQRLENVKAKL